ncbi:MAG: GGDEF domain-containing protein [Bacilli bacterium]
MKKKNKILLIAFIALFVVVMGYFGYKILTDEKRLTSEEKDWISNNTSTIQNINVLNDVEIVGNNGSGVFFDFIGDIKTEYNITINPITYNRGEEAGNSSKSFKVVDKLNDNHLLFKEEHYVLVGLPNRIENPETLNKVGILSSDEEFVKLYLKDNEMTFVNYNSYNELLEAFKNQADIANILIPLDENLTTILENDYVIQHHYSDMKKYFVYEMPEENDIFSNIIRKYYLKYKEKKLDKEIAKNTLDTFVNALNISEKDLKEIQADDINYGFVNNSPYEVLIGGNYGGIIGEYIKTFSDVTNTEFKFVKYKNTDAFIKALNDGKVDAYFDFYNINTDFKTVGNGIQITYNVLSRIDDYTIINSINSLRNKEVYVKDNSKLEKYLENYDFLDVKVYKTNKDLKKILKNDVIVIIDKEEYEYNANELFSEYNVKYTETINNTYNFRVKENNTLYILFDKFISTIDSKEMINKGLYNHSVTIKSGTIAGKIAKYSLVIVAVVIIALIVVYLSSRKIKIVKKIKKVDKMKYIDQLTSLKNRNYLSENISAWDNNTIYPQATIVIDLDNVQNINDTMGYDAGDEQIKAAANILIKTQLDNSDIIRTDGNEFLIYLVGYQDKQVVSYIRKLYKEFKNLPYEYGATIGYSMILDDIKTIEDAMNEAVDDMKVKKEEQE